jgi:lipoprotein-anchoring transpeptidase ErfK/SrfK
MPFGWVFVVLTSLGAIGGVVTGLSAHSIRTASDLPMEQPEPFERARLMSAAVPAPQEMELAAASTSLIEEPALFSPIPTYPMRVASPMQVASAPAAPVAVEPVAVPEPVAPSAPPAAAAKPQTPAAPAHHVASRPGSVLNDAQIASIKKRLNLTPDQASLWPAVETALRNISYAKGKDTKVASLGSGTGRGPMAYVDTNSAEVQQLKYAAIPLIMRLNDDQKREVRSMAYVMGLESVASSF